MPRRKVVAEKKSAKKTRLDKKEAKRDVMVKRKAARAEKYGEAWRKVLKPGRYDRRELDVGA